MYGQVTWRKTIETAQHAKGSHNSPLCRADRQGYVKMSFMTSNDTVPRLHKISVVWQIIHVVRRFRKAIENIALLRVKYVDYACSRRRCSESDSQQLTTAVIAVVFRASFTALRWRTSSCLVHTSSSTLHGVDVGDAINGRSCADSGNWRRRRRRGWRRRLTGSCDDNLWQ